MEEGRRREGRRETGPKATVGRTHERVCEQGTPHPPSEASRKGSSLQEGFAKRHQTLHRTPQPRPPHKPSPREAEHHHMCVPPPSHPIPPPSTPLPAARTAELRERGPLPMGDCERKSCNGHPPAEQRLPSSSEANKCGTSGSDGVHALITLHPRVVAHPPLPAYLEQGETTGGEPVAKPSSLGRAGDEAMEVRAEGAEGEGWRGVEGFLQSPPLGGQGEEVSKGTADRGEGEGGRVESFLQPSAFGGAEEKTSKRAAEGGKGEGRGEAARPLEGGEVIAPPSPPG